MKWLRPDGTELDLNEHPLTIAKAESLGWEMQCSEPEEIAAINAMESKDDVESYVMDLCGIDIDKRGNLESIKAKAIEIITNELK